MLYLILSKYQFIYTINCIRLFEKRIYWMYEYVFYVLHNKQLYIGV